VSPAARTERGGGGDYGTAQRREAGLGVRQERGGKYWRGRFRAGRGREGWIRRGFREIASRAVSPNIASGGRRMASGIASGRFPEAIGITLRGSFLYFTDTKWVYRGCWRCS
jgi:hypothetical protein